MVWTYVVKSEKQEEFMSLVQRLGKYFEEYPEKFEEVKSWKFFTKLIGGISGSYVDLIEFENLVELEKWRARMFVQDLGFKEIFREFMLLIDPATFSMQIWSKIG